MAGKERRVDVRFVAERNGLDRQARWGGAWIGEVWPGAARQAEHGKKSPAER